MRFKQANPRHIKKKKRNYSPSALINAFQFVKENGGSVRKAALLHGVPETTLRDRILGNVDPETVTIGKAPIFNQFEEAQLVDHFKKMAELGYGYSRRECVEVASSYAFQLGKRDQTKPLTIKWVKGFVKRWPELRVVKPRSLEHVRAKMASEAVVTQYFKNLKLTLQKHGLTDKPHLIFNIDEKGISVEHKAPHIVASSANCAFAVTSGKGKTITVIGGGSAAGVAIPPYFVFPGKRMQQDLLKGSSPGADGTMSETGWSNSEVFRDYLENHFMKFVPRHAGQEVLLLLDGHKSHVSVGLTDWAKDNNIVLFILPAHTSHILQPMDVSCYGPFQNIYNAMCHRAIRCTSAALTRYDVCELACKSYTKALCPDNIISGFKRTGIFPLNPCAVPTEYLTPSTVYEERSESDADSQATVEGGIEISIFEKKENDLKRTKTENKPKQRNTVSKLVSGKEINDDVLNKIIDHEQKQKVSQKNVKPNKKAQKAPPKKKNTKEVKNADITPGPSHISQVSDTAETSSDEDEEPCCVCGQRSPEELKELKSLVILKWVQCDGMKNGMPCKHWVHLQFCTPVRVVRLGDTFLCPHCT